MISLFKEQSIAENALFQSIKAFLRLDFLRMQDVYNFQRLWEISHKHLFYSMKNKVTVLLDITHCCNKIRHI